jgi:hypothetical protein
MSDSVVAAPSSSSSTSASASPLQTQQQHGAVQTRLTASGAVVPIRQLGFISRFTKSIKKYLLQPFVVGFAVALGMSFGTHLLHLHLLAAALQHPLPPI